MGPTKGPSSTQTPSFLVSTSAETTSSFASALSLIGPLASVRHWPWWFLYKPGVFLDQAVKTLFEIWHPEDIPLAFVGPIKGPLSTQTPPLFVSTSAETTSSLLLLKNFVHEVLKRSQTSGSILQTTLCYLKAVHSKMTNFNVILCQNSRSCKPPKPS